MTFGIIIDVTILSCCRIIICSVIAYCEVEKVLRLVYQHFPKDFAELMGNLLVNVEKYMFLQELMMDNFHHEISIKHQATSRETL